MSVGWDFRHQPQLVNLRSEWSIWRHPYKKGPVTREKISEMPTFHLLGFGHWRRLILSKVDTEEGCVGEFAPPAFAPARSALRNHAQLRSAPLRSAFWRSTDSRSRARSVAVRLSAVIPAWTSGWRNHNSGMLPRSSSLVSFVRRCTVADEGAEDIDDRLPIRWAVVSDSLERVDPSHWHAIVVTELVNRAGVPLSDLPLAGGPQRPPRKDRSHEQPHASEGLQQRRPRAVLRLETVGCQPRANPLVCDAVQRHTGRHELRQGRALPTDAPKWLRAQPQPTHEPAAASPARTASATNTTLADPTAPYPPRHPRGP